MSMRFIDAHNTESAVSALLALTAMGKEGYKRKGEEIDITGIPFEFVLMFFIYPFKTLRLGPVRIDREKLASKIIIIAPCFLHFHYSLHASATFSKTLDPLSDYS